MEIIKKLRKEKHMTQKQLADVLGCKRSTIAMWERGTSKPGQESLKKMADCFQVSTDYLLGLVNYPTTAENLQAAIQNQEMYQVLQQLSQNVAEGEDSQKKNGKTCPKTLQRIYIQGQDNHRENYIYIEGESGREYAAVAITEENQNSSIVQEMVAVICCQSEVEEGMLAAVMKDGKYLLRRCGKRNGQRLLLPALGLLDTWPEIFDFSQKNVKLLGKVQEIRTYIECM